MAQSSVSAASPRRDSRTSTLRRSSAFDPLGQQALADQPSDLGGDVGRGQLDMVGEAADRHACASPWQ